MTTSLSLRSILVASIVASSMFVMVAPSFAHAATFAYVNQSGDVSTVTANDWQSALTTAPNIDIHSGVMLLIAQISNGIVGSSIW